MWSLKESYVKLTGSGIAVDLSRLSFDIISSADAKCWTEGDIRLSIDGLQVKCRFHAWMLDDTHIAAIAWNSEDFIEFIHSISLDAFDVLLR